MSRESFSDFPDEATQPLMGKSLPISIGHGYGASESMVSSMDYGSYGFSPGTSFNSTTSSPSRQKPPTTPSEAKYSLTPSRRAYIPPHGSSMHHRMRLYQRLSQHSLLPDPTPPPHVVPAGLYFLGLEGKHGTIVTTYSILTTVVGAAFLVIPWGFEQAGIIGGVLTVFILGLIATYTGTLVSQHSSTHSDWMEVCDDYLGKLGYHACWISSVGTLIGALMAYFVIIDACMQSIVRCCATLTGTVMDPSFYWVPLLIMSLFLLSIINLKSLNGLMRFNSFAVVSVVWFIVVAVYKSVAHIDGQWQSALQHVHWFGPHPQYAAGMILMAFFIHNVAIEIFKHHAAPQRNGTAIAAAFGQAGIGYIVVGFIGYLAFGGSVLQNFITQFPDTDLMVMSARVALVLQLFTVFPLIAFVIRVQLFGVVLGKAYPGPIIVLCLNVVLVGICVLIAIFLPEVGTVLRYTGAICGFVHIFLFPAMTDYKKRRKEGRVHRGVLIVQAGVVLVGMVVLTCQFVPIYFMT